MRTKRLEWQYTNKSDILGNGIELPKSNVFSCILWSCLMTQDTHK